MHLGANSATWFGIDRSPGIATLLKGTNTVSSWVKVACIECKNSHVAGNARRIHFLETESSSMINTFGPLDVRICGTYQFRFSKISRWESSVESSAHSAMANESEFDGRLRLNTKNMNLNVFIYKGTFGNMDFENKKLTLLGIVWWYLRYSYFRA